MGKGDKKTKKGKIVKGTYGVRRPRKKNSIAPVTKPKKAVAKPKAKPKAKAKAKPKAKAEES